MWCALRVEENVPRLQIAVQDSSLVRMVDRASDGLEELRDGVRRMVRGSERERLREWIGGATPDLESMIQNSVERVFKLLELPRRSDIDALNENLQRVADAVETLQEARSAAPPAKTDREQEP